MRNFISLVLILLCTLGLMVNDAQAKRFGGGRSVGYSRSASSFRAAQPLKSLGQTTSSARRWLAPLAGLALGGLLGSMLMGHGLGAGIASWLGIAGIIMLVVMFLRRRQEVRTQPRFNQAFSDGTVEREPYAGGNTFNQAAATTVLPDGIDKDSFLREAKVHFMRLQAAYDQKNLQDIRQFTTPEVFAEIQLQLQERGDAPNVTEVVSLSAQLLDVVWEGHDKIASVKFTGLVKEEPQAPATMLDEIWHFRFNSPGWLVAGVQQ